MKITSCEWSPGSGWIGLPEAREATGGVSTTLVLAFCDPAVADDPTPLKQLSEALPSAAVVGCSTAGQIQGGVVNDVALSATIIDFDSTQVTAEIVPIEGIGASRTAGAQLSEKLMADANGVPASVIVISDGLVVNGTELMAGMSESLPPGVSVSGGLAGDGSRFERTWVSLNGSVDTDSVIGIALWGENLKIGHGSAGGWQPFGPLRRITKSDASVLVELDGQPALGLYKSYLGDKAEELPGSALLFPLRIVSPDGAHDLVRTVLAVDEEAGTMQFAGDIPTGWGAQLMRTTVDRLVEGASEAAESSKLDLPASDPTLALAVSCVGRRLVMGSRTEEEAEACLEVLGANTVLTGFYSYGEISPIDGFASLHNQTMTLTTLSEVPA